MKNQNIKCVFCSTSLKLTQTFTKHLQESCVGVKMPLKFITIFVGPLSQFGETEFGFRQMTLRKRWPVFPLPPRSQFSLPKAVPPCFSPPFILASFVHACFAGFSCRRLFILPTSSCNYLQANILLQHFLFLVRLALLAVMSCNIFGPLQGEEFQFVQRLMPSLDWISQM